MRTALCLSFSLIFAGNMLAQTPSQDQRQNAIEKLSRLQLQVDKSRNSNRAVSDDLRKNYDDAFAIAVTSLAPAARHSTGFPGGEKAIQQFEKVLSEQQALVSQISELNLLANRLEQEQSPKEREFLSQQLTKFCEVIGDRLNAQIRGLSKKQNESQRSMFRDCASAAGFLRCIAHVHLQIARNQLRQKEPLNLVSKAIVELKNTSLKNLNVQGDRVEIQRQLTMFKRRAFSRGSTLNQLSARRRALEKLMKRQPDMRRHLIAIQWQKICSERLSVAKENGADESVIKSLTQQFELSDDTKREFSIRIKDVPQRMREECVMLQHEIRSLQEESDKTSFSVATYTIRQRKIAEAHVKTAIEILTATNDRAVLILKKIEDR